MANRPTIIGAACSGCNGLAFSYILSFGCTHAPENRGEDVHTSSNLNGSTIFHDSLSNRPDHCQLGEERRIVGHVVGGFLGRSVELCDLCRQGARPDSRTQFPLRSAAGPSASSVAVGLDDGLCVPLDRPACGAHTLGQNHHAHARRLQHVGRLHLHLHRQPTRLGVVLDARHCPGNSPAHRPLPHVDRVHLPPG